jgi:hypothetical protein
MSLFGRHFSYLSILGTVFFGDKGGIKTFFVLIVYKQAENNFCNLIKMIIVMAFITKVTLKLK